MDAYMSLNGVFSVMFFVLCSAISWGFYKRAGHLPLISWTLMVIGFLYGLVLPYAIANIEKIPGVYQRFILEYRNDYPIATLHALVAVIALSVGWVAIKQRRKGTFSTSLFSNYTDERYAFVFWLFLLIAIVSALLYTRDYGGLIPALDYSSRVRSGVFTGFERSRFSFLLPLVNFASLSFVGFVGIALGNKPSIKRLAPIVIALSLTLYNAQLTLGRLSTFVQIASIVVILLFWRGFKQSRVIFQMPIVGLAAIYLLGIITELIGRGERLSASEVILEELTFPFASFFANYSQPQDLSIFSYLIRAPFSLIPSSLNPFTGESLNARNTELIMGSVKGEGGVAGEIPADLVTSGYMMGGIIGIVIYAFLIGVLFSWVENVLRAIPNRSVMISLHTYFGVAVAGAGVMYMSPTYLFSGNRLSFIALLLISGFLHTYRKNIHGQKSGSSHLGL